MDMLEIFDDSCNDISLAEVDIIQLSFMLLKYNHRDICTFVNWSCALKNK